MTTSSPKYGYRKSSLLTKEENEQIRGMLGDGCQGLATSVIQLFTTSPPDHSEWTKRDAGVICLVKDNLRRSYFLRLFCLRRRSQVWEMELYRDMDYDAPKPFLHVFEGQDCVVALNFASEAEAEKIYNIISSKLEKSKGKNAARLAESAVKDGEPSTAAESEQKAAAPPRVAEAEKAQKEDTTTPEAEATEEEKETPADEAPERIELPVTPEPKPESETIADQTNIEEKAAPAVLPLVRGDDSEVTVLLPPSAPGEAAAEPESVVQLPREKISDDETEESSFKSPPTAEDADTDAEAEEGGEQKDSEASLKQTSATIQGDSSDDQTEDITAILAKAREEKEARAVKKKEERERGETTEEEGETSPEEKEAKKDEEVAAKTEV